MAKVKKIRVRLQAYDHKILDMSVSKIVNAITKTGATVVGPIPLTNSTTNRKTSLHNLKSCS